MLKDNQIWEDEEYVLKIEQLGNDFHAVIFKKNKETLQFINIVFEKYSRIENLINKMNLKLTNKIITLKDL